MTKYLENKKASLILLVVCFVTYTIIAFTRNAYSAAIVSIIKEGYFTKSSAGIIATSFSITYGISQIVGSYYVDRISPFKTILIGCVITVFANVAMSISPTYWVIFISRAICGVAQFGVWPALLKILSEYINKDHRFVWGYVLPLGVTVGYVFSYLGVALISKWRAIFTISYVLLAVATVAFAITAKYAQKKTVLIDNQTKKEDSKIADLQKADSMNIFKLLYVSGGLFLLVPIFARGLIGGGITNWMPTMIMESYNASPAISNIMTTISTCANLAAVFVVMLIYPKPFKTQTTAIGMLFVFMLPFLVVSACIGSIPMLVVVICIAVSNTIMGALHQFNTVEIPRAYTGYNKVGMIAGIINALVTIAGVIASWLWGYMAERYSWDIIVSSWCVMAVVSVVFCFAATPMWKKFIKKQ